MRDITIGQYYSTDSIIHRLDPRTKLLAVLFYIIAVFIVTNPLWYVFFLVIVLVAFRVSMVPFSFFLRGLKAITILLLFTFFFRMVATPGHELASFWIFTITREGIRKAIQLTARIALMIVGASLLGYTTTPKSMADGLTKAFSPLEKIGVPIGDGAVMIMIAFRFIPVMLEETNNLMDAQASRGVEFENCSIFKKCKNVFTLVVPLFISSMERSADLAMAMEARGYTGDGETSKMYPLVYAKADRITYALAIIFLAATIVLRLIGIL